MDFHFHFTHERTEALHTTAGLNRTRCEAGPSPHFCCSGGRALTGFRAGSEGHRPLFPRPAPDAAPSTASPHLVHPAPYAAHPTLPPHPLAMLFCPALCSRPAPAALPPPSSEESFPHPPRTAACPRLQEALSSVHLRRQWLVSLPAVPMGRLLARGRDLSLNHRGLTRSWPMVDIHDSPSKE